MVSVEFTEREVTFLRSVLLEVRDAKAKKAAGKDRTNFGPKGNRVNKIVQKLPLIP